MYAVIRTGGKQYRVEEGETLRVEKLPSEVGEEIIFSDVLMIADGEGLIFPGREGKSAWVRGTVVGQGKGPKIIVFKYKPKKGYHRKLGHRQLFTEVRIDEIALEKGRSTASEEKQEEEKQE
jgi:large subunit ribosomal protein L21